jgi:hypothetical protein
MLALQASRVVGSPAGFEPAYSYRYPQPVLLPQLEHV